jgi:autotransporter translocation and assembly factor TamB
MRTSSLLKLLAALLAGLALLIAAGLVSLTHAPGCALVSKLVDGREISAVGTISLTGLQGNILSDFSLERLTLSDEQGVWLEARGVHVLWRARSLMGSTVRIESVQADQITVYRRPDLARESSSGGASGRGVRLNQLLVSELVLEDAVLGEAAALRVQASLTSDARQGQAVSAEIVRTDGASDRLSADFIRSLEGVIEGELSARVEADSPLAQLAYAEGRGFEIDADIAGDRDTGAADFVFTVAGEDAIEGRGQWRDGEWELEADTNAEAWPALPASVRSLLSGGTLTGQGQLTPRTGQVRFSSAAGEVRVTRSESPLIGLSGTLNADGLALVAPDSVSADQLDFDAQLNPEDPSNWLSGDVRAQGFEHAQLSMEALEARFVLGREGQDFRFDVNGAGQDAQWSQARAGAALGDTVDFVAQGVYRRSERMVRLDAARLQSSGVSASGEGDVAFSPLTFEGRFTLELDDAGRVQSGLSGPVTIDAEGGSDGVMLHIQGERLMGEGAPYTLATGLTGRGRISFTDGFALTDLELQGRYLRLAGGVRRPEGGGVWQGQLDYAVDAEGVGVGGLSGVVAGAAQIEEREGGLAARIQAQADVLSLGGASLQDPVLRVELSPQAGGALTGGWRFEAQTSERPLSLAGDIRWSDGAGRVDVASGQFADIAVQGEALLDAEALSVEFTARQDGAIQLWSASLAYDAPRQALMEGNLDLSAELERYRLSGVTVNTLNLRLSGPVDGLTFELNSDGAISEPYTLSVGGPVSYDEDGLRASLDFAGELTERTLTSPQSLELTFADGEITARARLALDGAGLEFGFQRDADSAELDYQLSAIPADLVMGLLSLPQAEGDLRFEGQFARQGEAWTGRSTLGVSGLSSASEPGLGAIEGDISLDVQPEGARLTGQFTDNNLEIGVDLARDGVMHGPGSLLEPDWRGSLRVNGDVAVLAALYMPEGEVLRGVLSVDADIDGLETSGRVGFSEGALQSAIAGRTFEPISAQGSWRNGALIIDSVQIGEGGKSGATARAEFRATSEGLEGEGRIDLNQLYLVDRPELSGGASGYAEFSLSKRVVTLTGEADIQRLDVRPSGRGGSSIPQIEVEELNRPDVLDRAYRRPVRIDLDYHLRADDRLFVSSRAFSSEWSADVHVTGTANRPRLSGEANLISGQASLLTAPFDLTTGRVVFDGPVNQTRLAIEGRHEADDLTVIGRVEGSVRAPEVHFESTPSLPEDEILSRLLFGSGVSDLSALQASQLAAQLSGAGWMDAMADVRAALGVDRLDVRQNSDGAITVLGGRQLTDDVYLELESGVGQALGSARIEWRLNPSLVLASEVSGDSSNEISLKWRRSFD